MILRTKSASSTNGQLCIANRSFACQLGRTGRTAQKREGDEATPIGSWPVISVYYRADRLKRPQTSLPINIIQQSSGWCDEPRDRNYNRPVPLPYRVSAEQLWREDHAYDLIVVLDYNFSRRSMHRGSAIFMHLAHDDLRPTAGCLAFNKRDLQQILLLLCPGDTIHIKD